MKEIFTKDIRFLCQNGIKTRCWARLDDITLIPKHWRTFSGSIFEVLVANGKYETIDSEIPLNTTYRIKYQDIKDTVAEHIVDNVIQGNLYVMWDSREVPRKYGSSHYYEICKFLKDSDPQEIGKLLSSTDYNERDIEREVLVGGKYEYTINTNGYKLNFMSLFDPLKIEFQDLGIKSGSSNPADTLLPCVIYAINELFSVQ